MGVLRRLFYVITIPMTVGYALLVYTRERQHPELRKEMEKVSFILLFYFMFVFFLFKNHSCLLF